MKLHLIIKSLGGSTPVVRVYGAARGNYPFLWTRLLAGHVRTYDFSNPDTRDLVLIRFEKEQADIFANKQQWPISLKLEFVEAVPSEEEVVTTKVPENPVPGPSVGDAVGVSGVDVVRDAMGFPEKAAALKASEEAELTKQADVPSVAPAESVEEIPIVEGGSAQQGEGVPESEPPIKSFETPRIPEAPQPEETPAETPVPSKKTGGRKKKGE